MVCIKIERLIFPKLKKLSGKLLKSIWIMDVITQGWGDDFRYRALFKVPLKDPKRPYLYIIEGLHPEFTRFFTIGKTYRYTGDNGSFYIAVFHNRLYGEKSLNIEIEGSKVEMKKAREIIPETLYNLNGYGFFSKERDDYTDFTKEIKSQSVAVTHYNGYEIIIPSFVIAPVFYFISTKMRKEIFSSGFEFSKLYSDIGRDDHGIPYIVMKKKMPEYDIPFIYYYATNEYGRRKVELLHQKIMSIYGAYGKKPTHVPLHLPLPFKQRIRARVRGIICDECQKILVEEIEDFNTRDLFGFNEIIEINRYLKGEKKKVVLNSSASKTFLNAEVADKRTPGKKRYSRIVEDVYERFREQLEEYHQEVTVIHRDLAGEDGKAPVIKFFVHNHKDTQTPLVVSFSYSSYYKDNTVKPAELERKAEEHLESKEDESKRFSFDDFQKMVGSFRKFNVVAKVEISKPKELPVRSRTGKFIKSKTYYKDGTVRRFITAELLIVPPKSDYKLYAGLVEIDQSELKKGISTFVIFSRNRISNLPIQDMLLLYLQGTRFPVIQNSLVGTYKVNLLRKNHPEKKSPSDYYINWCDTLLSRVLNIEKRAVSGK